MDNNQLKRLIPKLSELHGKEIHNLQYSHWQCHCLKLKDYRYITDYIHKVPLDPCGSHFIHHIPEPLMKERPKSDIIL